MKWLELVGVIFAAVGFGMLSTGYLLSGFCLGLVSCSLLIPVFYKNKLYLVLTLQAYFATMNSIGIWGNI